MTLADGRQLAYQVMGDPGRFPVLVLHGTPGSSRQMAALGQPAREHGLTLIAPDRAGYGGGHMLLSHIGQIIQSVRPPSE